MKMTIHTVSETQFSVWKAVVGPKSEDKGPFYPYAEILRQKPEK